MMTLPGTVAVTGGSRGIGAAICRGFLELGYVVVSLDLRPPESAEPRLTTVVVDLADLDATRRAAEDVARRFAITHLVHNAGVIRPNLLAAAPAEDLEVLARLHLAAPLLLLQAFLPAMKAAGNARVILISSRAALGAVTRTAYAASKAGMIGMGRTWALELAPHGITVNLIAPGPVAGTDMFRSIVAPGSAAESALARAIPVGRLGKPEDVANAVLFFARPESGFVTGQVLYVCGGASVGTLPL